MAGDGGGGGLVLGGKDKKKIHVNAAAVSVMCLFSCLFDHRLWFDLLVVFPLQLVDLKAALFSKQREATKGKQYDSNILSSRKVSDKVSTRNWGILISAHHHGHFSMDVYSTLQCNMV